MWQGADFCLRNCLNSPISFPWWDAIVSSQPGHIVSLPCGSRGGGSAGRSELPSAGTRWQELGLASSEDPAWGRRARVGCVSAQGLGVWPGASRGLLSLLLSGCLGNVTWSLARNHTAAVNIFFKSCSSLWLTIIFLKIQNTRFTQLFQNCVSGLEWLKLQLVWEGVSHPLKHPKTLFSKYDSHFISFWPGRLKFIHVFRFVRVKGWLATTCELWVLIGAIWDLSFSAVARWFYLHPLVLGTKRVFGRRLILPGQRRSWQLQLSSHLPVVWPKRVTWPPCSSASPPLKWRDRLSGGPHGSGGRWKGRRRGLLSAQLGLHISPPPRWPSKGPSLNHWPCAVGVAKRRSRARVLPGVRGNWIHAHEFPVRCTLRQWVHPINCNYGKESCSLSSK